MLFGDNVTGYSSVAVDVSLVVVASSSPIIITFSPDHVTDSVGSNTLRSRILLTRERGRARLARRPSRATSTATASAAAAYAKSEIMQEATRTIDIDPKQVEEAPEGASKKKKVKKEKKVRHASARRILGLARPELHILSVATVCLLLSSAASVAMPAFIGFVIAAITANGPDPAGQLQVATLILVAVFTVGGVFSFLRGWLFTLAGERVVARLRKNLFAHLLAMDITFYDNNKTGELMNRLSSDTTVVQNTATVNISMALRFSVQVLASLVMIFTYSWKLSLTMRASAGLDPSTSGFPPLLESLIPWPLPLPRPALANPEAAGWAPPPPCAVAVVPLITVFSTTYGRMVKRLSAKYQAALAKAADTAQETFSAIRTVRSFAMEGKEDDRHRADVHESFKVGAKKAMAYGAFGGLIGTIAEYAVALVLWYGGTLVLAGEMRASDLISFLLYTVSIAATLGGLAQTFFSLMNAIGASERVFSLFDTPAVTIGTDQLPGTFSGELELCDVTFAYPSRPEAAILNGVSLKVSSGDIVALCGASGSGKSSIVALLERWYEPATGSIMVDGKALNTLDASWWRKQLALVAQEPTLFGCSIRENILYGRGVSRTTISNAGPKEGTTQQQQQLKKLDGNAKAALPVVTLSSEDEAAFEAATHKANVHEFVSGFPDGYETLVGERGVQLSGGQKQRVAIARAIMVEPRLLILDEATSALDAEAEHLVQGAIDQLMREKTTLLIAHRLSTVRDATQICVMAKGSIVERGSHEVLLGMGGAYAALVKRQMDQPQVQAQP